MGFATALALTAGRASGRGHDLGGEDARLGVRRSKMGKLSASILEDSTALLIPFKGNALEWFPGVRANLVGRTDAW